MMTTGKGTYYADYLGLDRLLTIQSPKSAATDRPAHDEMLFIIVHQVYELWFKQVLHELDRVQAIFGGPRVDDRRLAVAAHSLNRIVEVLKSAVRQIDLLETMTPLDFLDFRNLLFPASGFQSAQFRMIEARLGLLREARLQHDDKGFDMRLEPEDRRRVAEAEAMPALLGQIETWLARTPFMETAGWTFRQAYRKAVAGMIEADADYVRRNEALGPEQRQAQAAALTAELARFEALFDEAANESEAAEGWHMSRGAVHAALLINLYRDEPALQIPYRVLSLLMDIDETMTTWRFRHTQMVERMIGMKPGTGGSSGHAYLRRTTDRHRVFSDLFALSTFFIPERARPPLPDAVRQLMSLHYSQAVEGVGRA